MITEYETDNTCICGRLGQSVCTVAMWVSGSNDSDSPGRCAVWRATNADGKPKVTNGKTGDKLSVTSHITTKASKAAPR